MGELRQKLATMSPERQRYALETLPTHFGEAGQFQRLYRLLTDFDFIEAKLDALDVHALIQDYEFVENAETLRLIQGALRLSAHILERDKTQLAGQLIGRLLSFKIPEIQELLAQASSLKKTWLRPLTPSLIPPGERLIRTLIGHTGKVTAIAVTPDGKQLVSGSNDNSLKIWDLETGKEKFSFIGHSDEITAVAITPDGNQIISSSRDGTVKVWSLKNRKNLLTIDSHQNSVNDITLTPDGKEIISGSSDKSIRIWNLETGEEMLIWKGRPAGSFTLTLPAKIRSELVNAVAVADTPYGLQVIAGSLEKDNNGKTWTIIGLNRANRKKTLSLTGHQDVITAIVPVSSGRQIISASSDKNIKIWSEPNTNFDILSKTKNFTLKGHKDSVNDVAVTSDGKLAISASSDKTIKIWNLLTRKEQLTITGHIDSINTIAVTPDGRQVISGSSDKTIKVWSLKTEKEQSTIDKQGIPNHPNYLFEPKSLSNFLIPVIFFVAFIIVSVNYPLFTEFIFNTITTGIVVFIALKLEFIVLLITLIGFTKNIANIFNLTIDIFELNSKSKATIKKNHQRYVSCLSDQTIKLSNVTDQEKTLSCNGHNDSVIAMAFTADGSKVISASSDKTIKVWNIETMEEVLTLQNYRTSITALATTPNSNQVILGADDGTIEVKQNNTERFFKLKSQYWYFSKIIELSISLFSIPFIVWIIFWARHHFLISILGILLMVATLSLYYWNKIKISKSILQSQKVKCLVVMQDENKIILASKDKTIKVWDIINRKQIFKLKGHTDEVNSLSLTPDGKHIVSGSKDKTIKVWNLEKRKEVFTLTGHEDSVNSVAITKDGKRLISASSDQTIKIWNLEKRKEVFTLTGHGESVNSIVAIPNSNLVISASSDNTLKLWDLSQKEVIANFTSESGINCCAVAPDGLTIVAGGTSGRLHFLRLENSSAFGSECNG